MKFRSKQKELITSIQNVSKAIQINNTLPILNNILIKAEKDKVTLCGTNLEIAILSSFPSEVENDGSFTIPAKILSSYVSLLKDGEVSLQIESANLLCITQGISETKIKGISSDEFPLIPSIDMENEIIIKADDLKRLISETVFAASNNPSRPVLMGLLFEINDKIITVVATDSYRLSERTFDLQETIESKIKCIVPAKTMLELSKIISGNSNVKIVFSKNQISFEWENVRTLSRLIEGTFPDYKAIIPKSSLVKVEIKKEEFLLALRKISIFAVEKNGSINMSVTNDGILHLFTDKTQTGESHEKVTAKVEGENTKVLINVNYLIDILNNIEESIVVIEMGERLTPITLKPLNKSNYTNIIMPLK